MAFGEKRKAARGRPKNSPNRVTKERVRRALDTGILPSDQLLNIGRLAVGMASRLQAALNMGPPGSDLTEIMKGKAWEEFKEWVRLAIDANTKAAPYFAYRLASLKLERGLPNLTDLSDDELDQVERVASLIAAGGSDPGGAGPTSH